MRTSHYQVLTLILGITSVTILTIWGGQILVRSSQERLNPTFTDAQLWARYRWSFDPTQRRQAALLLVGKSADSPRRQQRLLQAQAWGTGPLAAVALNYQAQVAQKIGGNSFAKDFWLDLLRRFPLSPLSADAYYALGRSKIDLRAKLMQLHPSHPASLAAALELQNFGVDGFQGVTHLAKWGPRWHGAEELFRKACNQITGQNPTKEERELFAISLAKLGDGITALQCLKESPKNPVISLAIAASLVKGEQSSRDKGKHLIKQLLLKYPNSKESSEAIRLLVDNNQLTLDELSSFDKSLEKSSLGISIARVRFSLEKQPLEVLRTWKGKPEILDLQWELARKSILEKDFENALILLSIFQDQNLPEPALARIKFWKGFIQEKKGNKLLSKKIWDELIDHHPPGYYTWRASQRLGRSAFPELKNNNVSSYLPPLISWEPLLSEYQLVNLLWRLGLQKTAWETWRSIHLAKLRPEQSPSEIITEARLRMAVGDFWQGLSIISDLALQTSLEDCYKNDLLHRSQHPHRFLEEVMTASKSSGLRPEVLFAVAKQESRFSPGVESIQGATGLMQLMPETAQEFLDIPLQKISLKDPATNLLLGARYLSSLLEIWEGNPFLALASYNAGPNIVSKWVSEETYVDPELWVERIPFSETRFYTKKVLGNIWSYLNFNVTMCNVKKD